jgi:hypothetical protein
MANFASAGTAVPNHIIFNSGTLDFGNERQVALDTVNLNLEYTMNPLYVLGSIKPQAYNRSNQKVTLTAKMKSFSPGLMAMAAGSSNGSAPLNILTYDGTPTLLNPVGTFFDQSGNQYQYQFSNALFKSANAALKMEDYAEFDFEMEASDVTVLSTPSI